MPGIITAGAGIIIVTTGLIVALYQMGIIGGKLACDSEGSTLTSNQESIMNQVEPIALAATRAYHERAIEKLDELSGGKYRLDSLRLPSTKHEIKEMIICGLWGNERLAFVNTLVSYEGSDSLGQKNALVILRSANSSWSLFLLSDRRGFIKDLFQQVPKLSGTNKSQILQPVVILNPPNEAKFKRFPLSERPDLEWTNAGSSVAVYLIESQYKQPNRSSRSIWTGSYFKTVSAGKADAKTIKVKAHFGVGMQPHRWRIWAVGNNGGVFISDWRIIDYIN